MATATTSRLSPDPHIGPDWSIQSGAMPPNTPRKGRKAFDEGRLKRMGRSMQWYRLKLDSFRVQRYEFARDYVGAHFGDQGNAPRKNPVNFMKMVLDTFTQHLTGNLPRYLISTKQTRLKASALDIETRTNYLTKKLNLQREFRKCAKDAMFLIGIIKTGICSTPTHWDDDVGQVFAKRLSFDDWVMDTFAREYEECDLCGNRYLMRLDEVREELSFDKQVRHEVEPQPRTSYNEQGDTKVSTLGPGTADLQDADLYDTVPMWDVWLPREHLVVTITADRTYSVGDVSRVLRVVEWDGPETGPYHLLGFNDVPDNIMPLSPASLTYDNNEAYNRVFRKIVNQAERQKTFLPFRGTNEEDARRATNCADGESVMMNGEVMKEVSLGGPNNLVAGWLLALKQILEFQNNNFSMLGGLASQSPTAEQDKMLNQNAGVAVGDMVHAMTEFARQVGEDIAWYEMTNPHLDEEQVNDIGNGVSIPINLTHERLHGEKNPKKAKQRSHYLAMNFEVEPYSMQPKGPEQHLSAIKELLQTVEPLLPMAQGQGVTPNVQNICRFFAKYRNMTELDDLFQFSGPDQSNTQPAGPQGQPPQGQGMQASPRPPGPPQTGQAPRRGGATQVGQEGAMMSALMGGGGSNNGAAA
jgi:hypothetical protein